jgi:ADP-ribose pyrophosphatase YjhB (NUDIX family)
MSSEEGIDLLLLSVLRKKTVFSQPKRDLKMLSIHPEGAMRNLCSMSSEEETDLLLVPFLRKKTVFSQPERDLEC